jgi:membrane-bound lytic murein transglycosylase MltF
MYLVTIMLVTSCGSDRNPIVQREQSVDERGEASEAVVGEEPPLEDQLLTLESEAAEELGLGERWSGDFDEMVERRLIRVLVVYSKTYYYLDGPRQRGITYELFKAFEQWLNEELDTGNLKIHVAMIPVSRDRLLPGVAEGLGDIAAAGLTVTGEREQVVEFAAPLMSGVREVVVTGPGAPALESLDDLAAKPVYVRPSSSYFESLVALNERIQQMGKSPMLIMHAEEYLEDEDILEMVQAGLVEITVVDEHKAEFWAQVYDQLLVHHDLAVRQDGELAWAVRKGSLQLRDVVNRFAAEHKKGTLLGNILFKRYVGDAARIKNAWADEDRDRFERTIGYFEEYAAQYAFDPLMMVAQGYQESGLDQSVVSRSGAIGIMQLLPSTAADKSVGIPDIENPENNVHAGIKYMDWIRTTYFDDDTVDPRNKALFAFASYNAGPNRIRRLRDETREQGLDPNVWFQNVEILAAKDIGQETVQYVSNIYKYYAAYRLLTEREMARR